MLEDFDEHKQPQGIRTLARTTFPMWRILNSEYTSTWRWALLKTDDALLMRVLQFALLLFCPKTKQCYDHGDIKHSRLKRFLEQPQAVSLLHVALGIRKNRGQRCHRICRERVHAVDDPPIRRNGVQASQTCIACQQQHLQNMKLHREW